MASESERFFDEVIYSVRYDASDDGDNYILHLFKWCGIFLSGPPHSSAHILYCTDSRKFLQAKKKVIVFLKNSIIIHIFAIEMKQSTKYKLDQLRLYLGVVGICYVAVDTILSSLFSFFFPDSQLVEEGACVLSVLLSIVIVFRHVRCRPLTQEEKEKGIWFQVRLMK